MFVFAQALARVENGTQLCSFCLLRSQLRLLCNKDVCQINFHYI